MNSRQLALLTRLLIEKCGGLEEASKACAATARPYSVQQLSRCQTADSGCYLPIDIMGALEGYCSEPVVSRAFSDLHATEAQAVADLVSEAADAAEATVSLQAQIRAAAKDGKISPTERDRLLRAHADAAAQLRDVEAALLRGGEAA